MKKVFILFLMVLSLPQVAQEISASQLLEQSIDFHDPSRKWQNSRMEFIIDMETPNRSSRRSNIVLDQPNKTFSIDILDGGNLLQYELNRLDSAEISFNFLPMQDSIMIDSLNLTAQRARFFRDYYSYLYGLPMKLKDEGTLLDSTVYRTQFNGRQVYSLKVNYEEKVGDDTWYFYFNMDTFQLVGYRFFHDESANDGEYIILEDLEIVNGLRIPKNRTWYTNDENELLGKDILVNLKVS